MPYKAKRQRMRALDARRLAPAGAPYAVRNDILAALLNAEYNHLSAKLERVDLKAGEILYRADQRIEHVYFPESAVVAMVDALEDGSTVEVGIIGHEGMVGINIFLGGLATPDRAIAPVAGSAMRMKTKDLRAELRFGSPLQRLLLRYTQALIAVISQSVACSQHHAVEQRLARLLLTMHGYAEADPLVMSQQSIAAMLGSRRPGITQAAGALRAAGLISYSRGRIAVLDEAGLQKKSCECYGFIREQLDRLRGDMPSVLSARARPSYSGR